MGMDPRLGITSLTIARTERVCCEEKKGNAVKGVGGVIYRVLE